MTPTEALIKALTDHFAGSDHFDIHPNEIRAIVERQFETLKSAGLLISPEVATEEMLEAVKPFPAHLVSADPNDPKHVAMRAATLADQLSVKTLWSDLVTAWQRGGGGEQ